MDKKSKILLWIFLALIIVSVGVTYWRIMIKKDYVIEAQTDCDPYSEECFVWECDPASTVEGEACTGDPEADIWYFKVARRNAAKVPLCDPNTDETCDPWTCEENEVDCEEEFCTQENMEDQYASSCVDPVKFTEENPIEEEEEEESEEAEEVEEEAVECEDPSSAEAGGDAECEAAAAASKEDAEDEEFITEEEAVTDETEAAGTVEEGSAEVLDPAEAPVQ